eukprot:12927318-Alexandrium_andersonii.AAC.1
MFRPNGAKRFASKLKARPTRRCRQRPRRPPSLERGGPHRDNQRLLGNFRARAAVRTIPTRRMPG